MAAADGPWPRRGTWILFRAALPHHGRGVGRHARAGPTWVRASSCGPQTLRGIGQGFGSWEHGFFRKEPFVYRRAVLINKRELLVLFVAH